MMSKIPISFVFAFVFLTLVLIEVNAAEPNSADPKEIEVKIVGIGTLNGTTNSALKMDLMNVFNDKIWVPIKYVGKWFLDRPAVMNELFGTNKKNTVSPDNDIV